MNIVDFIYNGYHQLKLDKDMLRNFVDSYKDKFLIEYKDGNVTLVLFYLNITDETLQDLVDKKINIADEIVFKQCLSEEGNNIHFGFVVGKGMRPILKNLKLLIKKNQPNTVSWYEPNMKRLQLFNTRRKLCHKP